MGKSKNPPASAGAPASAGTQAPAINTPKEIMVRIKGLKANVDKAIGDIVLSHVRMGGELLLLKSSLKAAGKSWLAEIRTAADIHPREASRCTRLFRAWGKEIGTQGADSFFARLPRDLKVLERLTLLPSDDVKRLLDSEDIKSWDRPRWNKELAPYQLSSQAITAWESCMEKLDRLAKVGNVQFLARVVSEIRPEWDETIALLPESPAVPVAGVEAAAEIADAQPQPVTGTPSRSRSRAAARPAEPVVPRRADETDNADDDPFREDATEDDEDDEEATDSDLEDIEERAQATTD